MSDNLKQRITEAINNVSKPTDLQAIVLATVLRDVLAEAAKGECRRNNVVVTTDLRFAQDVMEAISNLDAPCNCIVCVARETGGS